MGLSEGELRRSTGGRPGWLMRPVCTDEWPEALTLTLPIAGPEGVMPDSLQA